MILSFKLLSPLDIIPSKILVEQNAGSLLMYRHNEPSSFNILGQIPAEIFLYYHQDKLVSVFVKLEAKDRQNRLYKELQMAITSALNFCPDTLPTEVSNGSKWATDEDVLVLLEASSAKPVSFYLATSEHSLF